MLQLGKSFAQERFGMRRGAEMHSREEYHRERETSRQVCTNIEQARANERRSDHHTAKSLLKLFSRGGPDETDAKIVQNFGHQTLFRGIEITLGLGLKHSEDIDRLLCAFVIDCHFH